MINYIHVSKLLEKYMDITELDQDKLCKKTGLSKEELDFILTEGSEITLEQSEKLSKAFEGVSGTALYNFNKLYIDQQKEKRNNEQKLTQGKKC